DAVKISNAMSAAPAALLRNASVVEMNEDGSMKELRQGTNGWTCVPDDPGTRCASTLTRWSGCTHTRRKSRHLRRSVLFTCFKAAGASSNVDPYATKPDAGKPTITGPHVMVVGPAVKAIPGYDRTGNDVNVKVPYVIWKDTPYEHLMVPML